LAAVSVLVLAYSLVIVQQILLGVLAVVVCWLVYLLWRFVNVLERIAVALEQRVTQDEERHQGQTQQQPRAESHTGSPDENRGR